MPEEKNKIPKSPKTISKEDRLKEGADALIKEMHKLGDEITDLVKKAKTKYENADDKTKKAVLAGVAGAAALIAGAIGYKAIKKKK